MHARKDRALVEVPPFFARAERLISINGSSRASLVFLVIII